MQAVPLDPDLRVFAAEFARRFGQIASGLSALIARAFLHQPRLVLYIVPLCARLSRANQRCAALMGRLAAGKFPRRRAKRPVEPGDAQADGGVVAPRKPVFRFPTTEAWLIQVLRHQAAAYASHLEHLLAEPGAANLLAAAPTSARFLRPLCRMLGVKLPDTPQSGVATKAAGARSHPESAAPPSPSVSPQNADAPKRAPRARFRFVSSPPTTDIHGGVPWYHDLCKKPG